VSVETEVKLRVASARQAAGLLAGAGFFPVHERAFEANTLFDTPSKALLANRHLLRLREFRGEAILTFKGAPAAGPHKSRPEFETTAGDGAAMRRILEALGYRSFFRYEKFRTSFDKHGEPGHAVLDETPMGVFLELEGPGEWIDRTAASLGFGPADYITRSYGTLWHEECLSKGIPPADMVFEDQHNQA
jgi:adenylate cyclase class 2